MPEHPNIVFICTDQQRADFTKLRGFPLDTQPFVDSLARSGTAFGGAYSTAPICAPARCSMYTGRFPKAHRVRENSGIRHAFYSRDLIDVLGDLGYRFALCGKNHCHLTPERFDFWRPYGHWKGHTDAASPDCEAKLDDWLEELPLGISADATPFPLEAQHPYRAVTQAMEFVTGCRDQPFFLWLSFPEPHNPYQVPEPYYNMFPPGEVPERIGGPDIESIRSILERKGFKWRWQRDLVEHYIPDYERLWRRVRSNYCGMLRLIDDQVKRVLEFMERGGLRENTIFIYASDHGDFVGDYGLHKKGVEMPECLIRVPMIWTGWGIREGTPEHPALVSAADIMPTLCEAVGAEIPVGVQGRSLWPLLRGEPYFEAEFRSIYAESGCGGFFYGPEDDLDFELARLRLPAQNTFDELNSYSQAGYLKMVRMGDWKLCFDMLGRGQLYDLASDPAELHNRYDDAEVGKTRSRMLEELLAWTIRTEDDLPTNAYRHKWAERNWYAAAHPADGRT